MWGSDELCDVAVLHTDWCRFIAVLFYITSICVSLHMLTLHNLCYIFNECVWLFFLLFFLIGYKCPVKMATRWGRQYHAALIGAVPNAINVNVKMKANKDNLYNRVKEIFFQYISHTPSINMPSAHCFTCFNIRLLLFYIHRYQVNVLTVQWWW